MPALLDELTRVSDKLAADTANDEAQGLASDLNRVIDALKVGHNLGCPAANFGDPDLCDCR